MAVICFEVEKPGSKIRLKASTSVRTLFGLIIPRSIALALTASTSIPPPSSPITITIMLPSLVAFKSTIPSSGLPAARRSSADSIPWSIELRTECIIGSKRSSITDLSSSVSSPSITRLIFLLSVFERSRTRRGNRLNIWLIGTIRIRMTPSWSSPDIRPRFCELARNLARLFLKEISKSSRNVKIEPCSSLISLRISLTDFPPWILSR